MRIRVLFNGILAPNLAIVIPAFNEEETISQVIEEWSDIARQYDGNVIMINDGSTDKTLEIVQRLQNNNPRLIIIDKENSGHANSCLHAYQWAVKQGFRWIFQTDSDGQTDPGEFQTFWHLKEKHPLVFGYRPRRGDGWFRFIISKILMSVIFLIFRTYIRDANVPFRLMAANILSAALKNIPEHIYLGNAYLSVELNRISSIHWVRISFSRRKGGTPSVNFKGFFQKGLKVIYEFMRLRTNNENFHNPHVPLLEYSTLIYLTLPYGLFWFSYFKFIYAIILSALTLYGLSYALSFYQHTETTPVFSKVDSQARPINVMLIFGTVVFLWLLLSGVGGISFQNADYLKHNGIFYDLIHFSWPVQYCSETGDIHYLCYYLAYYLVPALVGKITNIDFGHIFAFSWSFLGIWLVTLWIVKLTNKTSLWLLLFFILFSGLDIIGTLWTNATVIVDGVPHLEWWAGYDFWNYSSNTAQLYWAPQHAIGGWLATSLLFGLLQNKETKPIPGTFLLAISFLWSNFVLIGLLPMMAVLLLKNGYRNFFNLKSFLPAIGMIMPLGFYYLGNQYPHVHAFIWEQNRFINVFPRYLLFCLLEFGIFAFFIFRHFHKLSPENRMLVIITMTALMVIPFYRFGHYNDLALRASIPSLFILQIILVRLWSNYSRALKIALVLVLIIGAVTPLAEIARSYKSGNRHLNQNISLMQIPGRIAAQYLGSNRSFYYKYLAKHGNDQVWVPKEIIQYLKK
ncbi:MAG TPA: glycosyltransferase [Smithella sp.]|nr:glycosyltransferase [Smithella sp.]HOG89131.1 glycosyltransferase [Smithella sp.]